MKKFLKTATFAVTAILLLMTSGQSAENENPSGNDNHDSVIERINAGGTIAVEGAYGRTDYSDAATSDEDSSDLSVEAELLFDMNISKYVAGHIGLKWEDNETDAQSLLDEGFFLIGGNNLMPAFFKAGKMYVPFGKFETNMISDPLTLETSETRKTAAEAGFDFSGFYASVYCFNGDVDRENVDDKIDNFGVAMGYSFSMDDFFSIEIGGGYINNIFESGGLMGMLSDISGEEYTAVLKDYIPGMTAFAAIKLWDISLIGEYTAMLKESEIVKTEIETGIISETIKYKKFKAWNIEAGYFFAIAGQEANISFGYQGVLNAEEYFPETRYMGVFSLNILENTCAGIEYDYDVFENDDKADTVTLKVEVAF